MDEVKHSKVWFRDSTGKRSISATMMWVAFIVTTLYFISSVFVMIGPVELRPFDSAAVTTYFIPILMGYLGRKWTKAKYPGENGLTVEEADAD